MLLSCFPSYLQYGKLSNFRIKELPQQNTHRLLQVVPELFLTIGKDKTIYIERDSNINIHKIDSNVFIQHNTLQYKKTAQATDNEIHKLNIPRGGEFFVCLSDGTKVWLNSESELKICLRICRGRTARIFNRRSLF